MIKETSSPQEILRIAGENRPVDRSEIGIESAADDKTVKGGHVRLNFNHDRKDDNVSEKKDD